jgi:pimeloyl-ACP methyl ester carboxylesterase
MNDATIHYVSYGTGPSILLLHGGLSNRLIWFSQLPDLVKAGRQVIVLDVRGHGISGLGRKALNYRLLARDAIGVLDKLNINKTDVVGWSDGGNTALILGKEWPARIGKIVAISANYQPSGLTPAALADTYACSSGPLYWIRRWWTGAGKQFSALEKRIKHMWRTSPVLQSDNLRGIEVPVLVIVGRHDIISIQHAKTMTGLLPHGTLIIVSGGHTTPVTRSVQINEAINGFLELTPNRKL